MPNPRCQAKWAWQIPPGTTVYYKDSGNQEWVGGKVANPSEREHYLDAFPIKDIPHHQIVLARWWESEDLGWMPLNRVYFEGGRCGECDSDEAPPDDYLCERCRRMNK